ncbi:MAG: AsnC family transcriptional regulator [Chloroflexota bacterium]
MTELNALDRMLLERMQAGVPLAPRPFAALGEEVGLDENEVLARLRWLKEADVIRQIGAIFDTRRLGYQSTLVAFHAGDETLEAVAALVSAHPGVSHNYARPHHYNLWFTLAVPPGRDVEADIRHLARQTGVDDWLNLPSLRVLKLKTHFKLDQTGGQRPTAAAESHNRPSSQEREFSPADVPLVRALQRDLPLVPRPFAQMAEELGLSEVELLEKARELEAGGIMRRFSAVLRHRRVGYQANGMACWVVSEAQIEVAGRLAATYLQVSHCYQRPARPPRWPYSLFTLIHGRTKDEVEGTVTQIAQETGIEQYEVLYSTREFKKERVEYFKEEEP